MFGEPLAVTALIMIGGAIVLSILGLYATRDILKVHIQDGHNDIAGFVFAGVGVIYAVVLAFVVFAVWDHYSTANEIVTTEAALTVTAFRDTQAFPDPQRQEAQEALRQYVREVLTTDWDKTGIVEPHTTADPLNRVWDVYRSVQPTSSLQETQLANAEVQLHQLEIQHHLHHLSTATTLPAIFWYVLIPGAILTLGFDLLFYLDTFRTHALMTGVLAATVAGGLFLILALNHPFSGQVQVSKEPFYHALEQFKALNIGQPR